MKNNGNMEIIIVSGMSGSGKNTVNNFIEDFGYFCIDNLPAELITDLLAVYSKNPDKNKKLSLTLDIRDGNDTGRIVDVIKNLKNTPDLSCRVIFLDASDEVIIARYKESRRIHPLVLNGNLSLKDALVEERKYIAPIKECADFVIDTSYMKLARAREIVADYLGMETNSEMLISCMSFGYKYGIPQEADLVFDVRCLPNPFYIPELKEHTGLENCIYDYVMSFEQSQEFVARLCGWLDYIIPMYVEEGKSHLVIAFGCTGGKHRSVTVARAVSDHLEASANYKVNAVHRDLTK